MHILVNAANVTASGSRALLLSLLPALSQVAPHSRFTFLLPDETVLRFLRFNDNTEAIFLRVVHGFSNDLNRFRQLYRDIPQLARRVGADVCLTLGVLGPIFVPCPHVVFLHQALLAYSKGDLRGIPSWHLPKRLYLPWQFCPERTQCGSHCGSDSCHGGTPIRKISD